MAMRRASTGFMALWMRTQGQTSKTLVEASVMANETAQGYARCVVAAQPPHWRGILVTNLVHISTGPPKTYLCDMLPYKQVRARRDAQARILVAGSSHLISPLHVYHCVHHLFTQSSCV